MTPPILLLADLFSERLLLFAQSLGAQLLWVFAPLGAFALLFHGIEVLVQRRLIQRFGWNAALWTGWIGTPIHEASHVVACWLFAHEIESVALFAPDINEGRLGYVRHTYHRGSWWQEAGNFFIGIAPLFGGATVLLLVTWAMYPQVVETLFANASSQASSLSLEWEGVRTAATATWNSFLTTFQPTSPKFWLYLYLVLCITLHAAPSRSDYHGGLRGGAILLGLWLSLNVVHAAFGISLSDWFPIFEPLWLLLITLLSLAAVVATIVAGAVYLATFVWDQLRRA
ncbi:MAG: hypothetical protein JNL67_23205 [Planctomycetaceae bacterium]|nr:hypothetical protein [Planctomycetaceae bacterium]